MAKISDVRKQREQDGNDMDKHVAKIRKEERSVMVAGEPLNGYAYMLLRHGSKSGPLSLQRLTIEDGEITEVTQISQPDLPLIAVNKLDNEVKVRLFRLEL